MGFLSDITGITGARMAGEARADASRRENQNIATIGASYDAARSAAQGGRDAWGGLAEMAQRFGAGGQLYLDALGVNGPEAAARARASFQEAPGFQYQVDQATDAVGRRANSLGMAASGNTLDAVRGVAQEAARTGWNDWLTRLSGTGQQGMAGAAQAAGGQQAGWNTLASLAQRAGQDSVGITQQAGQQIQSGLAAEAAARQAGAGNIAGLALGGANMLASGLGGGFGGGLSGLAKMFGGGSAGMSPAASAPASGYANYDFMGIH